MGGWAEPSTHPPTKVTCLGQAQQPQGFKDTPHGRGRSMYRTNRMLVETCPCPRGGISRQNPSNSRGRGSGARGGLVPRDHRSHLTFLGYWGFIPLCTPWSDPPVGCRTVLGTCPTPVMGPFPFIATDPLSHEETWKSRKNTRSEPMWRSHPPEMLGVAQPTGSCLADCVNS